MSRSASGKAAAGFRLANTQHSICGPEYISMVAAETERPRTIMPPAFRSFVWRLLLFFVGSALCMGIVVAYDNETLNAILGGEIGGSGTGAAS